MVIVAGAFALALTSQHNPNVIAAADKPAQQEQQATAPKISRMQLQAQYMGPLRDTLIQRWRDPVDGTVCYIYLPVIVQHAPGPQGLVQYGANTIGSISCLRPQ